LRAKITSRGCKSSTDAFNIKFHAASFVTNFREKVRSTADKQEQRCTKSKLRQYDVIFFGGIFQFITVRNAALFEWFLQMVCDAAPAFLFQSVIHQLHQLNMIMRQLAVCLYQFNLTCVAVISILLPNASLINELPLMVRLEFPVFTVML